MCHATSSHLWIGNRHMSGVVWPCCQVCKRSTHVGCSRHLLCISICQVTGSYAWKTSSYLLTTNIVARRAQARITRPSQVTKSRKWARAHNSWIGRSLVDRATNRVGQWTTGARDNWLSRVEDIFRHHPSTCNRSWSSLCGPRGKQGRIIVVVEIDKEVTQS